MRIRTICIVAAVTWLLPVGGCGGPEGLRWTAGAMVGDNSTEARLGAEAGVLEACIAPRYEEDRASAGDLATGARGYALWNAVDANFVGQAFGGIDLPVGTLYTGLFGGLEGDDGQTESGWLVGGRVQLGATKKYQLDLCTEYHRNTTSYREDEDDYAVLIGPRLTFK